MSLSINTLKVRKCSFHILYYNFHWSFCVYSQGSFSLFGDDEAGLIKYLKFLILIFKRLAFKYSA